MSSMPRDADVMDGTGRFLVPGFADMHVHVYTEGDLFMYVTNGVTTVRSTSAPSVSKPVESGIVKWVCRQTSQEVCPWNVSFASELQEPAFAAREGLDSRDVRVLAREFLAMSQTEFSTRLKGSATRALAR